MKQKKDTQWFVEKYYPDYGGANEIAWEGDLNKIVNSPDDIEEGDCADQRLKEYTQQELDDNQPKMDWLEAYVDVLERSIEGFIDKI